ncbi:MAG: Bug family tripartite tricarboxylate transporter substrate binding protein [Burkholderiales bacterium]
MQIARGVLLAVALLLVQGAWAQAFPARPVRVIVPFAPGGATDIVTRLVSQRLTDVWRHTVVVDNRAGASGNIGADLTAKATPDGYTLLMTSGSIVTANPLLFKKLAYSPERDLVAITNVASGPQVIAVQPSQPAKTLKDFIAAVKAKPRALSYGSAGVATQTHLAAENFLYTAGIDMVHVPYKGEGPALTDLVAGQIQMVTANLSAAIGFIQQGRLRGLAVTSKERVRQLPDVPAAAETLPGFENLGWFGFVAPAGTPKAVIDRLNAEIVKAINKPAINQKLAESGLQPGPSTPAELDKFVKEQLAAWGKKIKDAGIQPE